jgi:hypothetical protein
MVLCVSDGSVQRYVREIAEDALHGGAQHFGDKGRDGFKRARLCRVQAHGEKLIDSLLVASCCRSQ